MVRKKEVISDLEGARVYIAALEGEVTEQRKELVAQSKALDRAQRAPVRIEKVEVTPDPVEAGLAFFVSATKDVDDRVASHAKRAQRAIEGYADIVRRTR